jgi:dTDP-4-dehydrorhamnose reductase
VTRWLVTGAGGMLGRDLTDLLTGLGEDVTGVTRDELDITSATAVSSAVETLKPDVVVNCAAWTAVDDAEAHEDAALAVNGHGAGHLAAACRDLGATLVQLSTDYVFDGTAREPYPEDAEPAPRTAYGRTKLAGEQAVRAALPRSSYVVRTAWLYGAHGPSFVRTMIRLARAGTTPAVVDDQHGQPTWTADVARQIHALIAAGAPPGTYHATSTGQTTWFGLATEVFRLLSGTGSAANSPERTVASPTPTTSAAYRRPAPRPAYSVLGHDAWTASGIPPIGHWRDALRQALPAILAQDSQLKAS